MSTTSVFRSSLLLSATALILVLPVSPARADGSVEVSYNPLLTSSSVDVIKSGGNGGPVLGSTFRLGYRLMDEFDIYVGYRFANEDLPTSFDSVGELSSDSYLAGLRLRKSLVGSWLFIYGQVDVEAVHASLQISAATANGADASVDDWVLGVVPEAGIEAVLDAGAGVGLVARLGVGYAERSSTELVGDLLTSGVFSASQLALDLSGANASLTLGLLF